jgi:biotin transport system substrate-specific component
MNDGNQNIKNPSTCNLGLVVFKGSKRGEVRSVLFNLGMAIAFALATAYAAQLKIPLPWTPVPITLQTFVAMLAGLSLGCWWGMVSQVLYILCGGLGVPFFSGMECGLEVILGARGGYILGFVGVAFFIGRFINRLHSFLGNLFRITVIYFLLIYGLGLLHLGFWVFYSTGKPVGLYKLLMMGFLPFVPGDLIKITAIAFIGRFIRKK